MSDYDIDAPTRDNAALIAIQLGDLIHRSPLQLHESGSFTIGRGDDNNLVLDDPSISSRHAMILLQDNGFYLVDRESRNGTFIRDGQRLPPGQRHPINIHDEFRLGTIWCRIERSTTGQSPLGGNGRQSEVHFDVEWEVPQTPTVTIEGQPTTPPTLRFTIHNRSSRTDHFNWEVTGEDPDDSGYSLSTSYFKGDSKQEVLPHGMDLCEIMIDVPRDGHALAHVYQMSLVVTSGNESESVIRKKFFVDVKPFSQLFVEVDPPDLGTSNRGTLIVRSEGNYSRRLGAEWKDDRNALSFDPPRKDISLHPRDYSEDRTDFRVKPRKRQWFGTQTQHKFRVEVRDRDKLGNKPETAVGSYTSGPLIPNWALPIILAVLAGGAFLTWRSISLETKCNWPVVTSLRECVEKRESDKATAEANATASASETAAANAAAATASASETAAANAAAVAAQQTQEWSAKDDDGDGIPNSDDPHPNQAPTPSPIPTATLVPTPLPTPLLACPPDPIQTEGPGLPAILTWNLKNVAKVMLAHDGKETEVADQSSIEVFPEASTAYELRITLLNGDVVTCRTNVFVAIPTPDPDIPVVIPGQGQQGRRLVPATAPPP